MRTSRTILTLTLAALVSTTIPAVTSSAGPAACTPAWRLVDVPPSGTTSEQVTSVDVLSRRDVRFHGTARISPWPLRWNGSALVDGTQLAVPLGTSANLSKPSYLSALDGWAIVSGTGGGQVQVHAARWHGGRWTITPTAAPADPTTTGTQLSDVAATSAGEAWAVGGTYLASPNVVPGLVPTGALIQRWDGISWRIVDNPTAGREGTRLNAVIALAPDDVWAVGYQRDQPDAPATPLIEHFDGTGWTIVPAPPGAGSSALYAVDATGPDDIWAVGSQADPATGLAVPLAMHYDGSTWTLLPDIPDVGNSRLSTVYAAAPGQIWTTGQFGGTSRSAFLRYDGSGWTTMPSPGPQQMGLRNIYSEIDGSGPNDVWAAGASVEAGANAVHAQVARLSCGTGGR